METSICQRYLDSIASLIYASKSSEDDSSSNHTTYLNNRMQQLEQELEAKRKKMSLSLHQKHTNMEVHVRMACVHASVFVHVCMHACAYTCVRACGHVYVCVHVMGILTCMCECVRARACVYSYMGMMWIL